MSYYDLRRDLHPIKPNRATSRVMDFHVCSGAGVCGDRDPIRGKHIGGALDDVSFAGDAWPMNDAVLALQGRRLVRSDLEEGRGIRRVGSGDVFLPVIGAIAVGISVGL